MIDLSTLSKSYPYLSLAQQLGLAYSDVLIVSDMYTPRPLYLYANAITDAAFDRVRDAQHDICQVACAVTNGEIGHG